MPEITQLFSEFFTPFPQELKDDPTLIDKHLPLKISYSDFVHQGTSIRDMRSRVVTIRIKLSNMNLDAHARDKLRRLSGNRYDEKTDTLTVVTDR
jgi:small subunit ribosomal protein S35